jgi:hypothetical protein
MVRFAFHLDLIDDDSSLADWKIYTLKPLELWSPQAPSPSQVLSINPLLFWSPMTDSSIVRVRPPTTIEAARLPEVCYDETIRGDGALSTPGKVVNTATLRDIVQIVDDRILTFDPDEKDRAKAFMERGFLPPGTKRYKDKRFMFDRVFGHNARQGDVYEATTQPLLKGLLDGYNATVFAYGVCCAH